MLHDALQSIVTAKRPTDRRHSSIVTGSKVLNNCIWLKKTDLLFFRVAYIENAPKAHFFYKENKSFSGAF